MAPLRLIRGCRDPSSCNPVVAVMFSNSISLEVVDDAEKQLNRHITYRTVMIPKAPTAVTTPTMMVGAVGVVAAVEDIGIGWQRVQIYFRNV